MNQNIVKNRYLISEQMKGMFTKKTKIKIAIEEWFQNELNYQTQQYSDIDTLKETRVIVVESLIMRPNHSVSSFWYEFTPENNWLIVSYPIIIKLDQPLISIFVKLIIDTIYRFRKKMHKSLQESEKISFQSYISEMSKIRATKSIQLAEKLKQVLFLLVNQYYKLKFPLIDAKKHIPPSDKILRNRISSSLIRIRNNFRNFQQSSIKCRIVPYIFQDIVENDLESPLIVKGLHSLQIKNSLFQNVFSLVLISTQLLEVLDEKTDAEILDILLTFELISIENSLKFNRGHMEREIYSIVSKGVDTSETSLYKYYSKEQVTNAKSELENQINYLIFEQRTPIIKVYE